MFSAMSLLGLAHHTAGRIAELGFLLAGIAGVIFALGSAGPFARRGNTMAGLALAVGSLLLIVAFHWGHF